MPEDLLRLIDKGYDRLSKIRNRYPFTERTIQRHLRMLREKQLIKITHRYEGFGYVYSITDQGKELLVSRQLVRA